MIKGPQEVVLVAPKRTLRYTHRFLAAQLDTNNTQRPPRTKQRIIGFTRVFQKHSRVPKDAETASLTHALARNVEKTDPFG